MDRAVRKRRGHVRTVFHHRHAGAHRSGTAACKHDSAVENIPAAVGGNLCVGKVSSGRGILIYIRTGHFRPGNTAQTGYRRCTFHSCGPGAAGRGGNRIKV